MYIEDVILWVTVALVIGVLILGIWGCIASAPILDEGLVVAKYHEEASTTYIFRKIGNIHQMTPIRDDEDWVLEVKGTTEDGKERTERWEISREAYEQIQVGDMAYEGMRK